MSNQKTILIIAANPSNETQLRLSEEARDIEEGLRLAKHREQFILKQQQATRARDLPRAMQNHEPTIVHFCGHGTGEQGIILEDINGKAQLVSTEALTNFFKLFTGKVDCVILNACFSEIQAKAIVQHIPYVIGMSEGIADKAAIEFSVGFYGSLASGDNYERAYEFGRIAIEIAGIYGDSIPQLFRKTEEKFEQQFYIDEKYSSKSLQILANKNAGWEYRLFAELFKTYIQQLQEKRRDLEYGISFRANLDFR